MKAIYLDCFSGISGNMLLGAFLQAGVPAAYLLNELQKLPVADEFEMKIEEVEKRGIAAVHVDVVLKHDAHDHHEHEHEHEHHHGHHHRSFRDIKKMIESAALSPETKKLSIAVFDVLAEAEGKIHGREKDDVTFHEVGATDSIVDIVGTAAALDYLGIDKVFVSRVNTGSGFVECAHGLMPVPAPATAELLKGVPFYAAHAEKELTTPTGAAVIKTFAVHEENLPADFSVERIAYGAGTRDLAIPNVLRMYVGETNGAANEKRCLVETNIDDMNPQIYGYLFERLLAAGALDVWTENIFMKKNRPAQKLTVLLNEADKEKIAEMIFTETTSIGLRVVPVTSRIEAVRHIAKVETKYGEVRCKVSAYKGKIVSISAEYEDCKAAAESESVPLKLVQQEAMNVLTERLGDAD